MEAFTISLFMTSHILGDGWLEETKWWPLDVSVDGIPFWSGCFNVTSNNASFTGGHVALGSVQFEDSFILVEWVFPVSWSAVETNSLTVLIMSQSVADQVKIYIRENITFFLSLLAGCRSPRSRLLKEKVLPFVCPCLSRTCDRQWVCTLLNKSATHEGDFSLTSDVLPLGVIWAFETVSFFAWSISALPILV
jgi:hypothetical protein